MPVIRNLSGKQFGTKVKRLFELMETVDDWENYVSDETCRIVKVLYRNQNMTNTLEELDLKYPVVRSHIVRAVNRIENKKTTHLRDGKSVNAKELLDLVKTPGWEVNLTQYEVNLINNFKEYRNLYEVGRQLNIKPANIHSALYGNSQKTGILTKIKINKAD